MLADFVDSITQWLQQLVSTTGAPGITLVALFENLFPPTPSEFLYPLAGKLTYDNPEISLLAVIVAGVVGSLIGSAVYYTLGYKLGEDGAREVIRRFGTLRLWKLKITLFTEESFDKAMHAFEKHGGVIVLIGRVLPLVHGVVSIPAGVIRMNPFAFTVYTAIGAALWIAPLALLGYFLGSQWQTVLELMDTYESLCYALFAAFILYQILKRVRAYQMALQAQKRELAAEK
jgi:membrane protein DedA with SNARE-associated domain